MSMTGHPYWPPTINAYPTYFPNIYYPDQNGVGNSTHHASNYYGNHQMKNTCYQDQINCQNISQNSFYEKHQLNHQNHLLHHSNDQANQANQAQLAAQPMETYEASTAGRDFNSIQLTEFEQLDTLYDPSLESAENHSAMYLAISPCQFCFSFHSNPCKCGKYLYCGIICQISDDHHCQESDVPVPSKWPCVLCRYTGRSLNGLTLHMRRNHKEMNHKAVFL
eukprot:GFUD01018477.1.p1 GENE.GFUD01018477.1~~GFUD01018477.1.p1  ORF type:complete len:222 (-),score=33.73 GFUD01018477.1:14-679(-)